MNGIRNFSNEVCQNNEEEYRCLDQKAFAHIRIMQFHKYRSRPLGPGDTQNPMLPEAYFDRFPEFQY